MGNINWNNTIAKGPVVHYLDEMSKGVDAQQRLEDLKRGLVAARCNPQLDLAAILTEHLFDPFIAANKAGKLHDYLHDYWFDDQNSTVEFAALQPIAPAYAEGIIKTIELSLSGLRDERPKPIDSWWVVDHPKFEMLNLVNEHCVTLLIMTPRPVGIGAQGIWNPAAEAWSTVQVETGVAMTRRIENRPAKPGAEPVKDVAQVDAGVSRT